MAKIEDNITFDKFNVDGSKKPSRRSRKLKFNDNDFKEPRKTFLVKNFKKKKIIAIIILIILFIFFILFLLLRRHTNYITTYIRTLATSKSIYSSDSEYIKFKDGIVRYSRDGISFIKDNGEMAWVDSYNIDMPIIDTSDNYICVAGKNEKDIYLYDIHGFVINYEATRIIDKISVTDKGDVGAISIRDGQSFFDLYDIVEGAGKVYIKWTREEDGEVIDFDLSKDGKVLMTSLYYLDNKKIKSKVLFYNLDEAYDERMVVDIKDIRKEATFDDKKEDILISKVYFLDNKKAVSIYNGGFDFYNLELKDNNDSSLGYNININESYIVDEPNIILSISKDSSYLSIMTKEYAEKKSKDLNSAPATITADSNQASNYNNYISLYDSNGKMMYKKKIDIEFLKYYIDKGDTIFIGIDNAVIYDKQGIEKYNGKLYDDMIYIKDLGGIILQNIIVGCTNGVKRAILY